MKVGIFGGTFNPPHLGHLRLAEEVLCAHELDRVIFVPCYIPPHKDTGYVAAAEDRLEMTLRACAGNDHFDVSDLEILNRGTSYTVDTLVRLSENSADELYFIMGTDSLREIGTWKDYETLFILANFIVVTRPGTDFGAAWANLPAEVRAGFRDLGDRRIHAGSKVLVQSRVQGLDISSTRIRSFLKRRHSIRYLVTDSVRLYISENRLYE
ncbi:nicotinate-nucleotide adenylyltransferase [Thermodesulfobacteriota bacterium]